MNSEFMSVMSVDLAKSLSDKMIEKFHGSSTLSVPGIAFDFALPGQTTQGAYPWTDYDRFAVGPRNYVMLFNKQAEAGE